MTALARTINNYKLQTHPLVRESSPHQQTRNFVTVIKMYSKAPNGCFIPRQTGRLTVGHNIRSRLKNSSGGREPHLREDLRQEAEALESDSLTEAFRGFPCPFQENFKTVH
jgi:hypothetical protein